ncbi:diaminopimelate decarboxylase [Massilibacterium senegalense]|uniref:diaminopimelate decarboxylase n=1 Tax=Massilibacterium senegalense TaxID=1632858 RepID=UPI0007801D90|nr:diaminopimelate decarboxylase [Massilibacterium senegalense]
MYFHGTSRMNEDGQLEIGGISAVELAKTYGTPLFVYDVAQIRKRADEFQRAFDKEQVKGRVTYASKAFSSVAIIQLMDELGLGLDIVSGGELYTAQKANFPMEKIHFHGNNKSISEIEMALEAGIGYFVVDNFFELQLLDRICQEKQQKANILLRITPGIEAHTHDYISTGQEDSKFGFDLTSGQVDEAIEFSKKSEFVQLDGIHCHIGSQIFTTVGFLMAIEKIFAAISEWQENYQFVPSILNVGGGFGIRYVEGDEPLPADQYVEAILQTVKKEAKTRELPLPEVWIEPGRSLVGEAGTTLYTIGSEKTIPSIRKYVAVDGGMGDNIRPALYQAKYEAALANRLQDKQEEVVSIAGKCCESGDMLLWDVSLPKAKAGDLLAMFCTGAYGYSMASNYNRLPRPAVVFVENGKSQLVVRRETYEDIVRLDLPYEK